MYRRVGPIVLLLLLGGAVRARSQGEAEAPYLVIVHPDNPVSSVSREFLAEVFLKRTTEWRDGAAIEPVDLDPDSAVRRRFSEDVLERSVAAVRSYWQQVIFSGRGVPPVELDGDAAAIRFVLLNPGAIAYVSGTADVGEAKVVTVR